MSLRDKWLTLSRPEKLTVIGTILVPLLVAFLPLVINAAKGEKAPQLEVVDYRVHNGLHIPTPLKLEIMLKNSGDGRSVITRAIFRIRHFTRLKTCNEQGNLPESNVYGVDLPANPVKNETTEEYINQELGAQEADRFSFKFTLPKGKPDESTYLYRLDVSLLHDKATDPLRVGTIVISLPVVPAVAGGDFWSSRHHAKDFSWLGSEAPAVISCLQANSARLKEILATKGRRSKELEKVADELG